MHTQTSHGRRAWATADPYDEETFRYFLAIEAKRYERSSQRFAVVLVSIDWPTGTGPQLEASLNAKVFSSLTQCVRETDFVGWYEKGCAAAAVLTSIRGDDPVGSVNRVVDRLTGILREELGPSCAGAVRLRAYQLPEQNYEFRQLRR